MAEFLIYDKNHWMDSLTQEQIDEYTAKDASFPDKYSRRLQLGDVIEVRPDGYWDRRGFDKECYGVLKVPNLVDAKLDEYGSSLYSGIGLAENMIKRRRYNFSNIIFDPLFKEAELANLTSVTVTDKAE